MKTKEELNTLKEEVENLNEKLQELTEEEIAQVSGGVERHSLEGKRTLVPGFTMAGAEIIDR